ncbi:MAG: hypothetical protein K6E21_00525 [Bacilli bacterium]|nr:hypothetical protein [Bacilli bacterium]
MKKISTLLIVLIVAAIIIAISFIDGGAVWHKIFIALGMILFVLITALFLARTLPRNGKIDTYALIFLFVVLAGYGFYCLLNSLTGWVTGWPLWLKILIPSLLVLSAVAAIALDNNGSKRKK